MFGVVIVFYHRGMIVIDDKKVSLPPFTEFLVSLRGGEFSLSCHQHHQIVRDPYLDPIFGIWVQVVVAFPIQFSKRLLRYPMSYAASMHILFPTGAA